MSQDIHTLCTELPFLSCQQMCELLVYERRQRSLTAEANTLIYSCFSEVHQRIKAFCPSLTRIDPNHHIRSSISIHLSPKPSIPSGSSLSAFYILKALPKSDRVSPCPWLEFPGLQEGWSSLKNTHRWERKSH